MRARLLYLLLGLQVFGLVLLYGYQLSGLGYPVYMLRTMPVDPRDLLRGDYIILGYEISRLPEQYKDHARRAKPHAPCRPAEHFPNRNV